MVITPLSDFVEMHKAGRIRILATAGASHTHPNGEIDLSFPVEGQPRFDGRPAGWIVYVRPIM